MTSEQLEQLLHESESPYLDFKRDQYPFVGATDAEKTELLKDILAFANSWRRTDAFILIGVEEVKGERGRVHGVSWHFDDAMLQQFVNGKTQRAIDFSVETLSVDGRKIDAVRIPVQQRPFYLRNDFARLKAGIVYFRRGTTTAEANPDEIANMGKIMATSPIARFVIYARPEGRNLDQRYPQLDLNAWLKNTGEATAYDIVVDFEREFIQGAHNSEHWEHQRSTTAKRSQVAKSPLHVDQMVHIGNWFLDNYEFELDSSLRKFKPTLTRYDGSDVRIRLRIFAKDLPSVIIPIEFSAVEIKGMLQKTCEPIT